MIHCKNALHGKHFLFELKIRTSAHFLMLEDMMMHQENLHLGNIFLLMIIQLNCNYSGNRYSIILDKQVAHEMEKEKKKEKDIRIFFSTFVLELEKIKNEKIVDCLKKKKNNEKWIKNCLFVLKYEMKKYLK